MARSFFSPDLPQLSDKRAQGTSKHCWQRCSSSWERALPREHLVCWGLRTTSSAIHRGKCILTTLMHVGESPMEETLRSLSPAANPTCIWHT